MSTLDIFYVEGPTYYICNHMLSMRITILLNCMVVFQPIFSIDIDMHYLTFMGRNLENRKKLKLVQIINATGWIVRILWIMITLLAIKIPWNNTRSEHCFLWIFLGWTIIHVHSVGSNNATSLSKFSLNVYIVNELSHYVWGSMEYNGHIPGHRTDPYCWIILWYWRSTFIH